MWLNQNVITDPDGIDVKTALFLRHFNNRITTKNKTAFVYYFKQYQIFHLRLYLKHVWKRTHDIAKYILSLLYTLGKWWWIWRAAFGVLCTPKRCFCRFLALFCYTVCRTSVKKNLHVLAKIVVSDIIRFLTTWMTK